MCTHNITHPNKNRVPLEHLPINRKPIFPFPKCFQKFESPLFTSQWNQSLVARDIGILSHFYSTKILFFFLKFRLFQKREVTLFSPGTPPPQPLVKIQQPVSLITQPYPLPCPAQYCLLENLNTLLLESVSYGGAESRCQASSL